MKKNIGILLSFFTSSYLMARPIETFEKDYIEETPAEIIEGIIEDRKITGRDIVNILSAFEKEEESKRERYRKDGPFKGFLTALEDELNEDRFFYIGENYDENEFLFKSQFLSAAWDTLVANYSLFDKMENTIATIERTTTIETPARFRYRIRINPELDLKNNLGIRARFKSKRKSVLENIQIRLNRERVEISRGYPLERYGRGANFRISFSYDYSRGYETRAKINFPWWFD